MWGVFLCQNSRLTASWDGSKHVCRHPETCSHEAPPFSFPPTHLDERDLSPVVDSGAPRYCRNREGQTLHRIIIIINIDRAVYRILASGLPSNDVRVTRQLERHSCCSGSKQQQQHRQQQQQPSQPPSQLLKLTFIRPRNVHLCRRLIVYC